MSSSTGSSIPDPAAPSNVEWEEARRALAASIRRASIAELGGFRPLDATVSSWWGGNFVGAPGETAPVCAQTGRTMQPVLQIRLDQLPHVPTELATFALITIWFDLESDSWWDANNGSVFCLRAYPNLEGLVPLGPAQYAKGGGTLPILPVRWRLAEADGPAWDDISLSRNVAAWHDASWFFDNNHPNFETKVGGWPTWAQSSQGADGFMLQIDSEQRGRLMWGDSGHTFFFLENGQWRIRGDCY